MLDGVYVINNLVTHMLNTFKINRASSSRFSLLSPRAGQKCRDYEDRKTATTRKPPMLLPRLPGVYEKRLVERRSVSYAACTSASVEPIIKLPAGGYPNSIPI